MSKKYDNQSISSLKDEQQVRQRPAVIFGTNDVYGCANSIFEIIANALDEAREGYGDTILIEIKEDGTVRVKDNGRGVPMDWNEREQEYNWKLVYCTLYASGKYNSDSYSTSLGLNGLGATATQYASEFMTVVSVRDGVRYTMNFKKGKPVGELQIERNVNEPSGTDITFKPDKEVFTDINVPIRYYIDKLRRQAILNPNIKFIIRYGDSTDIVLHYPNGIKGFIEEVSEKPLIQHPIYFKGETTTSNEEEGDPETFRLEMEVAITFSRETYFTEIYHNSAHMSEGGVTVDALKYAITRAAENYAKQNGKMNKSDKFVYRDIEEILVVIGATACPGHKSFFKNQTKTALNNKSIGQAYYEFIYYNFSKWLTENRVIADKIIDEMLANKEARENAEAVKKKVLKKLSSGIDKFSDRPKKFIECASKSPLHRELFIVEGDSAAGACKFARDAEFQAIMPIRGKIMNCLKADLSKILRSDVIVDLLQVIGCGIEVEDKYIKDLPKFDLSRLNWSKILICTDADTDGMQIRCLILTMIYRLMPTLLKKGKVYIAETPLFEIEAKGQSYFAYSDAEKEHILSQLRASGIKDSNIKVQRSKGLGENDPEMLNRSTMNPATRRIIQVEYPEDEEQLAMLFNALLGDDIETRRQLIDDYFDMDVDIDY